MNSNILLCFENEIYAAGLTSIIKSEILGANIKNVEKYNLIDNPRLEYFDIIIIQIEKNKKSDLNLLTKLKLQKRKASIIVFTSSVLNDAFLKLINYDDFSLIVNTSSSDQIIAIVTSKIISNNKKIYRSTSLNNLLSAREYQIGLMLIKGDKISIISKKTNLTISTISTFKKRIIEKTKVNNLFELAACYNKNYEELQKS